MPNWTHEQQQAIETDGKNIIVMNIYFKKKEK